MNKNIFKSILFAGIAGLMMVSCSEDYLETSPQSSTSPATIFESVENAKLAVNGLSCMMTHQYLGTQGMNGEGTIKTWYGNYPGNDFQKCNLTGWSNTINGNYHANVSSSYDVYPWYYYYKLIGNANQIICNIDAAEGADNEKNFIKAQALVFRAYSFLMLSQLYCHRWMDTNGGSDTGIVLRIDTSTGDQALASLAETYVQIYADLDEAISLFKASGLKREASHFYEPDIDVAYAVYARAALTREDWAVAANYAAMARQGHKLMTEEQYQDGCNTPNDEWIWGVYEAADQTLYYYSFFAYQGSDSSAGACRTYPCAISKELYNQIPATDARRALWLEPTAAEAKELNAAGRSTGALYKRAFNEYGDKMYSTSLVYQYMQYKFRVAFLPGGGSFSIFRAAEMYLTEAEADCHLGKDADAQKLLEQLNAIHNPEYSCAKTGADLLTEVKLYRRIDLWGEGFDWFDHKRWGATLERKSIKDGGSFHNTFAIVVPPQGCNEWTWVIPRKETDYNKLVN